MLSGCWETRAMMKILLVLFLFFQIGCAGMGGFISGVAGNMTSDAFARIMVKDKDCENDKKRNDPYNGRKFIYVNGASY